jgi:hypothetical protein
MARFYISSACVCKPLSTSPVSANSYLVYISTSTYVIVLGLLKVSLIIFYVKIFKTRRFEITAYIVLVMIIINTLVIFFITIFLCSPVESFWNRDIKGKCMDQQGVAYANSASAIAQDLVLLILPLVFIRNLGIKLYRKIAVGFMFAIGTFGCVVTIIRLQTLSTFKPATDPTWDYVPVTIWTELEFTAVFICVSLPFTRVLLTQLLPVRLKRLFTSITHSSKMSDSARENPDPLLQPQKAWLKPSSWNWIDISTDADDGASGPGTQKSSRGVLSALSNYSECGVAVTRPPFHQRHCTNHDSTSVELHELPRLPDRTKGSHSCKSCDCQASEVTALPNIGCLPEHSYSVGSDGGVKGRDWS